MHGYGFGHKPTRGNIYSGENITLRTQVKVATFRCEKNE